MVQKETSPLTRFLLLMTFAMVLLLSWHGAPAQAAEGSVQEAKTIEEAASILRSSMIEREKHIELRIAKDAEFGPEDTDAILQEVYKHTGAEDEGDYLKQSVCFTQIQLKSDEEDAITGLTFDFRYTTTASQEESIRKSIEAIDRKYAIASMTSDYDKILAIYELVGDSVNYDYDRKDNALVLSNIEDFVQSNYTQQTAYAALVQHKAVCEGYALLFYRLALHYGLDSRVITGSSQGEAHGWNLVRLNKKYYQLDPTWDSGNGRSYFNYFLKCQSDMYDHEADEESLAVMSGLTMALDSYSLKTPTIKTSGIYKYVLSYGAIIVGIDHSKSEDITIPSALGGKPVVSLDCSLNPEGGVMDQYTTGISFPSGLYRIKGWSWIFRNVKTVSFPASLLVTSETMNSFNVDQLKTIRLGSGSKSLKLINGALYTYDGKALVKYPVKSSASTFVVNAGTEEIYPFAFRYACNLTKVTLPDSVEGIGSWAFEECYKLTSINIPGNLKSIGEWAFAGTSLSGSIKLPSGMEWIGGAVYDNVPITAFSIPTGNAAGYFVINDILCYDYHREGIRQVIEAPSKMKNPTVSVPDDFLYVTDNSFRNTNLKEISLNEGLVDIGSSALEGCRNLVSVIVPASVRSINERAFGYNQKSLKSVYVLSKDLEIWGEPFSGTTTTVYGYTGSTIETYCKNNGISFKAISAPVYNWGVKGERCSMTLLNAKGKPVSYQADRISSVTKDGVVTYTASFSVNGKSYKSSKSIKMDYNWSFSSEKKTVSSSFTLSLPSVKEDAKITYQSSDPEIASVDKYGKVSVHSVGKLIITAYASETSHYNRQIAELYLTVIPKTTKPSSFSKSSTGLLIKWKENTTADGYYIYRDSTLIKTIKSAGTCSYKDTKTLTHGKLYKYSIVAYKADADGRIMKASSGSKKYCYLKKPSLVSLSNPASRTMLVKWGKISGLSGYQIQYSLSSKFASGNKTVTVSGASTVSKKIASLTKGKTYYVRIRSYKTISSVKYYSPWSSSKSATIRR